MTNPCPNLLIKEAPGIADEWMLMIIQWRGTLLWIIGGSIEVETVFAPKPLVFLCMQIIHVCDVISNVSVTFDTNKSHLVQIVFTKLFGFLFFFFLIDW